MRRLVLAVTGACLLACAGAIDGLQQDVRVAARAKAMQACTKLGRDLPAGTEDKVCACVADEIVGKLTPGQLADLVKDGPDPSMVQATAKRCAKKSR